MSEIAPPRLAAALAALGLTWLGSRTAEAASPQLLVFLHTAVKQRALQDALSAALGGVSVTAVGRVADFERQLASGPDAVLTLPEVLKSKGLSASLQGHRGGSATEKYVLLGVDSAPKPGSIASVGALDILGRSGTTSFVNGLLGARPRVVRVTKVEDLLPLLQMRRADAVLLPARLKANLAAASRLNLASTELSGNVGLPALSSSGGGGSSVLSAMRSLSITTSKLVGVDSWR